MDGQGAIGGVVNIVSKRPSYADVPIEIAASLGRFGTTAIGIGGALAPEVTNNSLGMDLTPTQQYVYHQQVTARATSSVGSDAGAAVAGANSGQPAHRTAAQRTLLIPGFDITQLTAESRPLSEMEHGTGAGPSRG